MARVNHIQTNFSAGKLSPRLEGRIDFARYHNGVAELVNMTVLPHGGAAKRTGFRHVAPAISDATASRLIPFEFSVVQAYVLELGEHLMRFFRDGGQIVLGGLPLAIATPWSADEIFAVQTAQSADVLYLVHPDHAPRKLSRTSHVDWTLEEIAFADGPYLDANTGATTMAASATTGSVAVTASGTAGVNGGLGFLAGDIGRSLRLEHGGNHGWGRITAVADATHATVAVEDAFASTAATAAWRLGLWSDTTGYPAAVTFYEQRLIFAGTRDFPQRIDGSRIADFESFAPGANDDDAFAFTLAADQVNAIRWINAGQNLTIGTVGGEWQMRTSANDAPITPTNVQVKRQTTYGSAALQPRRVGSAVLFLQRAGRKVRELSYSFEADSLVAPDLTLLAEHLTGEGIADMTFQQEPDPVLWCVRGDGVLLGMTYERSQDVVAWHRHVIGGREGAVESVTAIPSPGEGEDRLWIVARRRVNGVTRRTVEMKELAFGAGTEQADAFFVDGGLTYDGRSHPAALLSLDGIAGDIVLASSPGVFAPGDVGKLVSAAGGRARILGYGDAATVTGEVLIPFGATGPFAAGAWSLDEPLLDPGGLEHLEGESVTLLADGAVVPPQIVSGGKVVLDAPATRIHAGLAYGATIRTLPVEAGADEGTAQGRRKRIHRLIARLWRSLGLKAGTDAARLDIVPFRSSGDALDGAPPLLTGDMRVALRGGWNREGRVVLAHDLPLPLTVLSLVMQLAAHEP